MTHYEELEEIIDFSKLDDTDLANLKYLIEKEQKNREPVEADEYPVVVEGLVMRTYKYK